jgi:hypothetical protein
MEQQQQPPPPQAITSTQDAAASLTLPAAFAEAWKRQRNWEAGQGAVADALVAWERCNALLQPARPGLFSRNEHVDDFNTSSLKYLLVPFYLGGALGQAPGLAQRAHNLRRAQAFFSTFLTELERHDGLTREDLNVWHRETQLQPTARRTEKINRARRERELQQALEQLQKRRGSNPANEEEGDDHVDEELERELWLNTIQLAILKAIHELEAIEQELPFAERMSVTETARELDVKRAQQERPKSLQEDTKLVPLGEGQLPSKATERARKQQDVFRPSWNLPTVSVEEAAAVEMRFAAKSKPEGSAEASDDEEDESDEALRKAREWDEYKDTHPIGWGNRINQG